MREGLGYVDAMYTWVATGIVAGDDARCLAPEGLQH